MDLFTICFCFVYTIISSTMVFKEEDLSKLCDQCFQALEEESEEIFSASPLLRLFGDAMNTKS